MQDPTEYQMANTAHYQTTDPYAVIRCPVDGRAWDHHDWVSRCNIYRPLVPFNPTDNPTIAANLGIPIPRKPIPPPARSVRISAHESNGESR
jgi:hypothetical protein